MILPASYSNGFAPRDGSPLYPELWRGCPFAFAACLGPSGSTLREWSGVNNHGTLVSIPETDWVISGSNYALQFIAGTCYVQFGVIPTITRWTISAWINPTATTGYLAIFGTPATGPASLYLLNGKIGVYTTADRFGAITVPTNAWSHVCVTGGDTIRIYVNGVADSTFSDSAAFGGTGNARLGANAVSTSSELYKGLIDDLRVLSYQLSPREIRRLATRRGIAYELAPRRRSSSQVIAVFNRRRRLLLGAS